MFVLVLTLLKGRIWPVRNDHQTNLEAEYVPRVLRYKGFVFPWEQNGYL